MIDSSRILAGKVVVVEQRVVFKLDLPNKKVISVKSKITKTLGEVLRPILHKYNYKLDLVQVNILYYIHLEKNNFFKMHELVNWILVGSFEYVNKM